MLCERAANGRRQKKKESKRRPLADFTNVPSSSSSSSSLPLTLKKEPRPNPKSTNLPTPVPARSAECGHGGASAVPTSSPRVKELFLDPSGDGFARNSLLCTPNIAKGAKSKFKEDCLATSCLPEERIRTKGKLRDDAEIDRRKAYSVQCQKPKKKQRCKSEATNKNFLPQDFIEKQKAYYAEVDAFELPEEVVSESELE